MYAQMQMFLLHIIIIFIIVLALLVTRAFDLCFKFVFSFIGIVFVIIRQILKTYGYIIWLWHCLSILT